MTIRHRPLHGTTAWPASLTAEHPYEDPVPRQLTPYVCSRGHQFTVPFAAEVTAPAAWTCRCGAAAGHTTPGPARSEHERHMGQLLGRRSVAELEELLAQRLTDIRGHQPAQPEG